MAHGSVHWLATFTAFIVPNFSSLNVIASVAHGNPIPGSLVVYNTIYAVLYATAVLAGAVLIFERRNLK